ncbi:Trehalose-6-P synthase/phosphatase complex subunit [Tieghemiomyces parasiticus]|uniref:Trehalose-6-P synthase/phosphatase complex subunit n=1 Tax=Tieghemiomyces parasiticus TaxID=78921 RepID=A0A9W8A5J6_9FUNG|nr:Trehalose-6-P synthase/phosphatase complex subunit [Tieghemiomyces parasiticus]
MTTSDASRVLVVSLFAPFTVDLAPSTEPAGSTPQRRSSVRRLSVRPKDKLKLSTEAQLRPSRRYSQLEQRDGPAQIGAQCQAAAKSLQDTAANEQCQNAATSLHGLSDNHPKPIGGKCQAAATSLHDNDPKPVGGQCQSAAKSLHGLLDGSPKPAGNQCQNAATSLQPPAMRHHFLSDSPGTFSRSSSATPGGSGPLLCPNLRHSHSSANVAPTSQPVRAADLFGPGQAFSPDAQIPPLELEGSTADPTSLTFSKKSAARAAAMAQTRGTGSETPEVVPTTHIRTPSSDADAPSFTVDPLNVGNIGLFNAVHSSPRTANNHLFIGTLGTDTDDWDPATQHAVADRLYSRYSTFPVYVTQAEIEGHYNQFCKQALWPMFHYILPEYPKSMGWEKEAWEACLAVHRHFADAVVAVYQEGDVVWINDYHLMLLPGMLRQRLPSCKIGFFLHVPFPSSEVFRCLHVRKEILRGLLGADLIGFQTFSFARHFAHTCSRILSCETSPTGIHLPNSDVAVGIFPIGIDPVALERKKNQPEVQDMARFLRDKYAGRKVIIGRDKLDHVKGVRQKLLAFENFLARYPEWRGKVVLIQIALSTAEANETQSHVSDVVARINSRFGSISYQPVVFLHQDIAFDQYLALLTFADVFINTSLRDGMNLTSHEYIICQETSHNPLIISEFAGTYGLLGAAALRVNPWDATETAEAMREALTMSEEERTVRWRELYRNVTTNTSRTWVESFVDDLEKTHDDTFHRYGGAATTLPKLRPAEDILPGFREAPGRRLLLLNYDSLMESYGQFGDPATTNDPEQPSPSDGATRRDNAPVCRGHAGRVATVLRRLTSDPRNLVYVLSGRTKASLDRRLGDVPQLGLTAENGCFVRSPGRTTWEDHVPNEDMAWREPVREILEYYQERTPGSWLEQKDVALVWHYRSAANPSYGAWQAGECQNHIDDALAPSYPIHVIPGSKSLEVTLKGTTKATVVQRILDAIHPPDEVGYVLAIGCDRGDEEMFRVLTQPRGHYAVSSHPPTPGNASTPMSASPPLTATVTTDTDQPASRFQQPQQQPLQAEGDVVDPNVHLQHRSTAPPTTASTAASTLSPAGGSGSQIRPTVVTCATGARSIKAQFFIPNVEAVRQCLEVLADAEEKDDNGVQKA